MCGEVFLFFVILFLLHFSETFHVRMTRYQEDVQWVGGLGRKAKKKHKRKQKRRGPYQCLPVHFLLLKNFTIFRQLQLLQDFSYFLNTPVA